MFIRYPPPIFLAVLFSKDSCGNERLSQPHTFFLSSTGLNDAPVKYQCGFSDGPNSVHELFELVFVHHFGSSVIKTASAA